jgi:hypothetical protein
MKTVELPTTVLIDQDISFEAKGIYCYLYSRHELHGNKMPNTLVQLKEYQRGIKELIKNEYIKIKYNNIFFLK